MPSLSKETLRLIEQYQFWKKSLRPKEGVATIHVDEFASKIAGFYEKIREIVDWKEQHLMRRAAITRKLKRLFLNWELISANSKNGIAEPLVLELIRGGHFPNDKIEESKIGEVQKVIDKYTFILKNSPQLESGRRKLQFHNWLLEVAACEIEETLAPSLREKALIGYMFELMKEKIKLSEKIITSKVLSEEEKNIQIYIAVQQALFKLDSPIISYNLLKYRYPQWNNASSEFILDISRNIYKIWDQIEEEFSHPLSKKFYAICEKYDTPYLLLGDILSEEDPAGAAEKLSNPENLETLTTKAYKKRLSTLKTRLGRAAMYSTLSILLTNAFSMFIIEIPVAKLLFGSFTLVTMLVDVLGPTFLMFLFVVTVKLPPKSNLNIVILETMKIVYEGEKRDIYQINFPRKRGIITKFIIGFIYLLGAVFSLGVVYGIFLLAQFPPTSVFLNLMFVALITFAGIAIRKRAEELTVEEKPESILSFFADVLLLPVAGLGGWISKKWKKYNAIAAFFNALIDMPFTMFLEFLEKWRFFLKEKKEEIH